MSRTAREKLGIVVATCAVGLALGVLVLWVVSYGMSRPGFRTIGDEGDVFDVEVIRGGIQFGYGRKFIEFHDGDDIDWLEGFRLRRADLSGWNDLQLFAGGDAQITSVAGFRYLERRDSLNCWSVRIPLWFVVALTIAFVLITAKGPVRTMRRQRRRSRGRCVRCGYSLVGNVSGICSECGEPTATSALSPTESEGQVPLKLSYAPAELAPVGFLKLLWLLSLYGFVTFVLIQFLEPGLTPPGFTGWGFTAMPLLILGAVHASRHCARWPLLFAYGCLGAMLLVPSYLDNRRGSAFAMDDPTVAKAVVMWAGFSVLMGGLCVLASRAATKIRGRGSDEGTRRMKKESADSYAQEGLRMDPHEFNRLALGRPKFDTVEEFAARAEELLCVSRTELHALADASGNPRRSAEGVLIGCRGALELIADLRGKGITLSRNELIRIQKLHELTGEDPNMSAWAGAVVLLTDLRLPGGGDARCGS